MSGRRRRRARGRPPGRALAAPAIGLALLLVPALSPSPYALNTLTTALVFALLATGLNLLYGYLGLLSFAQVAFWGIGAYAAALAATDLGASLLPALALAGACAALVGIGVGYAALRLSRHAFAIVTLSLSLLAGLLARDWVSLTRGPLGIPGLRVPPLHLPFGLAPGLSLDPGDPVDFFRLTVLLVVPSLALLHRLLAGPIGRTFLALKMNEPLARSQGVSPLRYKLFALGLSAGLSGAVGGLFVFHLTIVDPTIFDFYYTQTILVMVVIGGAGSFWGTLVGALVFTLVPEALRIAPDVRMVAYGAILIAAILVLPDGLAGFVRARRARRSGNAGGARARSLAGRSVP